MKNLNSLINDYINSCRKESERELEWFRIQKTFKDAVSNAALAQRPRGKRFKHQFRIPKASLQESRSALLSIIDELNSTSTFKELYEKIYWAINNIDGIGKLTIYDTALRIGAKLNFEPDCIYLHAGTKVGAKRLNLNISKDSIPLSEIPKQLRIKLSPREIEDFLCIYKNRFIKAIK